MHPYWIPQDGRLGVGITARSEADALALFEAVFGRSAECANRIESVDQLDQNHVVPNMGNILKRGVWFPLGYEHISN